MSLYAEYLKERIGDSIIEGDGGFAVYRYINEKQVYIVDIYTKPEHRRSNVATYIANTIVREAKDKGCTQVLGTVVPGAKNATTSIKVLLAYGMELFGIENGAIILKKEI